ncbi:hypothetical protein BH09BAC5_BH09BAC5_11600 [soil metagenome]
MLTEICPLFIRNSNPKVAPKNMYSHNAVALSNREIDHSDYQDCMPIAEKIARIILS